MNEIEQAVFDNLGQKALDYFRANFDSEEMYEFDGMNCDDCDGWDGVSRRCSCGNRRVYWIWDKSVLYAEAW